MNLFFLAEYMYLPIALHEHGVTQGQFFLKQSFPPPIAKGRIAEFIPSQKYWCNVKCKHPCPGFELGLLCPFSMTLTITPPQSLA